jgi:hypothetical protein
VGETVIAVPLTMVIFPGVITPVPLAMTAVRLADPPAVIDVGFAVKLVIAGAEALTVTVAASAAVPPEAFVTVRI